MNTNKTADQLGIIKASMWLGYLVMLGMGAVLVAFEPADGNSTLAVLFCVVMFTANFFAYIGLEQPAKDERARRIGTLAATYSWFITLSWFCTVMIIGYAAIIAYYTHVQYNGVQAMGFALFTSIVSMPGWLAYYSTKGDLELPDNG
jgi:uncharacterized membrane protein